MELEPGGRLSEIVRRVEETGADVISIAVASDVDATRVTLVVQAREPELEAVLDDVPPEPAVRTISLEGV